MKRLSDTVVKSRLVFSSGLLGSLFSLGACTSHSQNADVQTDGAARYPVSVTRRATITASQENVFDFIVAEDVLPKVLTGYGPLPAVTGTSDRSGPWDQPGATRTVHLQDGGTVREQVTGFERPHGFHYQVSAFTNPIIRRLADSARGEWTFREADGVTHIDWTYTFFTDSRWARLPLSAIVNVFWRGYMDVCLQNSKRLIE